MVQCQTKANKWAGGCVNETVKQWWKSLEIRLKGLWNGIVWNSLQWFTLNTHEYEIHNDTPLGKRSYWVFLWNDMKLRHKFAMWNIAIIISNTHIEPSYHVAAAKSVNIESFHLNKQANKHTSGNNSSQFHAKFYLNISVPLNNYVISFVEIQHILLWQLFTRREGSAISVEFSCSEKFTVLIGNCRNTGFDMWLIWSNVLCKMFN